MKPISIFAMVLGLSLSATAGTQKNVYLYEDLNSSTDVNSLANQGYCVTWVNAMLADYEDRYAGVDGASYSCNIQFQAENPSTGQRTTGVRRVNYSSKPHQFSQPGDIGKMLEKNYGYFGIFGALAPGRGAVLDLEFFGAPNLVLTGIYQTGSLISQLFQTPIAEQQIRLVPHFGSIYNAQQAACKVISLELAASACAENQAAIVQSVQSQIQVLAALAPLRAQMIPVKP